MSDLIYVDIELNQEEPYELGALVEGEIVVIPSEDIDINYFFYEVFLEVRGLLETEVYHIQDKRMILSNKVLEKEKEHRFSIRLLNNKYATYNGRNVELLVKFESTIKLNQKISDNKILSKIGYKKDGKKITSKLYLNYISKVENLYSFKEGKTALKLDFFEEFGLIVASLIFFAAIVSYSIGVFEENYRFIYVVIGFLILLWFFYHLFSWIYIGTTKAEFKQNEEGLFEISLENSKQWKNVRTIKTYYTINEEVTDNRGTSPSKIVTKLFTSPTIEKENPSDKVISLFKFPKEKFLSVKFKDVRSFWLLNLSVKTFFGLEFVYSCEIDMETIES